VGDSAVVVAVVPVRVVQPSAHLRTHTRAHGWGARHGGSAGGGGGGGVNDGAVEAQGEPAPVAQAAGVVWARVYGFGTGVTHVWPAYWQAEPLPPPLLDPCATHQEVDVVAVPHHRVPALGGVHVL
jgi:hypothetical protein